MERALGGDIGAKKGEQRAGLGGDLSTLPDAEKERLGFVFPYFFSVIFFDDRNLSV